MHAEIAKLKSELDAVSRQDAAELESAIENYLDESDSWRGAQGDDKWSNLTIGARFLVVNQNTVAMDPGNTSTVNGLIDLDMLMQVTEGVSIFTTLQGATDGTFPSEFPTDQGGFGPPATMAGMYDGIGVNGSVTVRPTSAVQILEAGVRAAYPVGEMTLNWEMGLIDPRERFLQNKFMRDENTQFISNQFDDESAISWATRAAVTSIDNDLPAGAPTIIGLFGWISFGAEDAFTARYGYFNTPGEWFDKGQLYLEIAWRGNVRGREMNVSFMYMYDGFSDATLKRENDSQWGASWDWLISDKIGLFFRIAGNTKDVNPVDLSLGFGLVYTGIGSRKDDQLGFAMGMMSINDKAPLGEFLPADKEWTFELYYKWVTNDGKLQITPHLLYVSDPGGGGTGWQEEKLWILGIRFFVPF
ncbi:MAG: carbohydrate porin [Planctomycetota bacterium]|jgi:hypothetical protein